jgi:hypothetical protein
MALTDDRTVGDRQTVATPFAYCMLLFNWQAVKMNLEVAHVNSKSRAQDLPWARLS